jgi:SAM-dependent methyltransferase
MLDLYCGAYGPCLARMREVFRTPEIGAGLVDEKSLSQAFATVGVVSFPIVPSLIRQLGISSLLDLACGPATLLIELACADANFHGWGVDLSQFMCTAAMEGIAARGLSDRIQIFQGDVCRLGDFLPGRVRESVDTIFGGSILNQFFQPETKAVDFLRMIAAGFPGRTLIVADYYGRLGRVEDIDDSCSDMLIHDVAQAISGQGVPPPNVAGWYKVYESAGCQLVHTFEGDSADWFVHLVRL